MNDRPHTSCTSPDGLLILPRLRVQNANAISSPLTWGFPAPSAFLGFAHALERRLAAKYAQVFDGVGIVCHDFSPQVFQPNRRTHRVFTQTRNPVYLKRDVGKFIAEGTPAAIVEEGRSHLEISLVIALRHGFEDSQEGRIFATEAYEMAQGMRLAGGSLIPSQRTRQPEPCWISWPDALTDQRKAFARLRHRLLPGFALVHRPDLLREHQARLTANGAKPVDVLDTLLDLSRLNFFPKKAATKAPAEVPAEIPTDETATPAEQLNNEPVTEQDEKDEKASEERKEKVVWEIERHAGWLVPLPIGYAGISELHAPEVVANTRDESTPFRFVESIYSLGQWIGPHRLSSLEQLLWRHATDPEAGLYRCSNRYSDSA